MEKVNIIRQGKTSPCLGSGFVDPQAKILYIPRRTTSGFLYIQEVACDFLSKDDVKYVAVCIRETDTGSQYYVTYNCYVEKEVK